MPTYFFDMDGTLLNSMPMWRSMNSRIIKNLGIDLEDEKKDKIKEMNSYQLLDFLNREFQMDLTEGQIGERVEKILYDFYKLEAEMKPHVEGALDRLKKEGSRMIVTTATPSKYCISALERLRIMEKLDFLWSPLEAKCKKSDPDFFIQAINKIKSDKKDIYLVDDAPYAIKIGKDMGLNTIGVFDLAFIEDQDYLKNTADFYIKDFSEWPL